MITKLAKAQENWIFKLIFVLVAISFISLFGVTGYLSSASQNRTVVNVNGEKTTQSEFSYRLQREITALKNLAGDDFELTEELRNSVADSVLKQIVDESVLDQTMLKYGIYFPKFFVQQVVLSQSQFRNPLNGQFNPELFKRYLSSLGMSEADYLASVKRLMGQRILVSDLVQTFNVPSVLTKAIHTMDNRRKTFKYVIITPDDVKIERKISDEEVKQ
jgi:peptidyl-prolyl cis-trans isomerase D